MTLESQDHALEDAVYSPHLSLDHATVSALLHELHPRSLLHAPAEINLATTAAKATHTRMASTRGPEM